MGDSRLFHSKKAASAVFLVFATLIASVLCVGAFSSYAEASPGDPKNLYGKKVHNIAFTGKASWFFGDDSSKYKITNLKSSNSKVVSLKSAYSGKCFFIDYKKAGTAKISFNYKGKRRTTTIKLVKYANPFKSLKVGGREMGSIVNTKNVTTTYDNKIATKKSSYKLDGKTFNVKAKSGWKITKIKSIYTNQNTWKDVSKTLKNGGVVKGYAVEITAKNKKSGFTETIRINEYNEA